VKFITRLTFIIYNCTLTGLAYVYNFIGYGLHYKVFIILN